MRTRSEKAGLDAVVDAHGASEPLRLPESPLALLLSMLGVAAMCSFI